MEVVNEISKSEQLQLTHKQVFIILSKEPLWYSDHCFQCVEMTSRESIAMVLGSSGSGGSASSSSTANNMASSLRRISEDPMLRPFLSSLFDPQNYVKNIIRDGKSEECLQTIQDCMDNINDEIQRYIGQHKVSLVFQYPAYTTLCI